MKKIHYTEGYGGKLNYLTTCGKEIHSHSEKESATIDPDEVTCGKCKKTRELIEDLAAKIKDIPGVKRRIYIESDVLSADEVRQAQRTVIGLCDDIGAKYTRRVFSELLDYAWYDLEKTWAAVKKADEIYSDSSLMPLSGGSYVGAPVIFNGMCERAIKEGVAGKDVYILNAFNNIYWDMIDVPLMKKAFKKNNLFMYNDEYEITKIDVSKIKK